MKKILFLLSGLFILTSIAFFISYRTLQVPDRPVHYHANFAVFEDGSQVNFTKPEFMHISPCTDDGPESSDPEDNVHLHDGVGNVVHVHANGITWKTLFTTLKYWDRLEGVEKNARVSDLGVSIYSDGKEESFDYLLKDIKDNTHLLISIGNQSPSTNSGIMKQEMDAVGDKAKEYTAGKIGIEQCGATGPRTLWKRFQIAFGL